MKQSSAARAIGWGGLIAGILDIMDAIVFYGQRGVRPMRILQSISSGMLGASAFRGGWRTAVLGLALHFVIAFGAAIVYFAASRFMRVLRERPVICGLIYGVLVYLFMNYVVLPLSAVPKNPRPQSWPALINGVAAIVFLVGLPIALAVRRFGR